MRSGNCVDLKKLRENFKNQFIITNFHLKADLTQYLEERTSGPERCIQEKHLLFIDCHIYLSYVALAMW